ncbi:hypothetical protein HF576_17175 [Microbacterium sp. CFH 90308]|uniref:Uncharacterized protein n=1 Tax=Microbacterium salsuginis TaxID=2722803 RepID=A0ABX1KEU6_9MICO|nr:hypothetical protein [Microbacterium sp. CFH 90308]NLP85574.1 hypothetical protein [Microbacterium sp. CFH 90308]
MSDFALSPHEAAVVYGRSVPTEAHARQRQWIGSVRIARHWNGPRRSANGGIAAGRISQQVDADVVTVVLKRPVPLDRPLDVFDDGRGAVQVHRGRRLIATARPGRLDESRSPGAPSFEDAVAARAAHPLTGTRHLLSDCVVCGPDRADGMHVTPGPVPGSPDVLASPWIVGTRHSRAGIADYAAVWGAMDCTSYPAMALRDGILCLLGTMSAQVERQPRVGERLVVHGWTREVHGRRYETSVAITDAAGAQVARAESTWVAVKRQRLAWALGRVL